MSQTIRHEEFFPTQDRVNFCLLFGPSTIWMKLTHIVALPGGSDSKESTCNRGDLGSIPGLGRFPGGEHCNPLQYSSLENSHGQRSLAGYNPWGGKESDLTEWLSTHTHKHTHTHTHIIKGNLMNLVYQFKCSVQSLSHVRLFVTPWTATHQASLSITSFHLLKLMSIESVMPSNYLILWRTVQKRSSQPR